MKNCFKINNVMSLSSILSSTPTPKIKTTSLSAIFTTYSTLLSQAPVSFLWLSVSKIDSGSVRGKAILYNGLDGTFEVSRLDKTGKDSSSDG